MKLDLKALAGAIAVPPAGLPADLGSGGVLPAPSGAVGGNGSGGSLPPVVPLPGDSDFDFEGGGGDKFIPPVCSGQGLGRGWIDEEPIITPEEGWIKEKGFAYEPPPLPACDSTKAGGWFPSCFAGAWDFWGWNGGNWLVFDTVFGTSKGTVSRYPEGTENPIVDWITWLGGGENWGKREANICNDWKKAQESEPKEESAPPFEGGGIGFPAPGSDGSGFPGLPIPQPPGEEEDCEVEGKSSIIDLILGVVGVLLGLIGILASDKDKPYKRRRR